MWEFVSILGLCAVGAAFVGVVATDVWWAKIGRQRR